jgi:hypothetical protein
MITRTLPLHSGLISGLFLTFAAALLKAQSLSGADDFGVPAATALTRGGTSTVSGAPSSTATPTATPGQGETELQNISTRLEVQTGENVSVVGFIITGNAPKKVIVRGIGPSLTGISPVLADPVIELHGPDGSLITSNDNWKDSQQAAIEESTVAPTNDLESAIVVTLAPGGYTAIVSGKNATSGIGLVELYDLDPESDSQLANISSRGFVQPGTKVMIGGIILGNGTNAETVLIRALGPSLAASGITDFLADPFLQLFNSNGTLLITNDNWQENPSQQPQIIATALPPTNDLESAIITSLAPGAYTAIVSGKDDTSGVALIEVYQTDIPSPLHGTAELVPNGHIIDDSLAGLTNPDIKYIRYRDDWERMEPVEGQIDFADYDHWKSVAKSHGKGFGASFAAGDRFPAWLAAAGGKVVSLKDGSQLAVPWDPVVKEKYLNFVKVVAAHDQPDYVAIAGLGHSVTTGITADPDDIAILNALGGLDAWLSSANEIVAAYVSNFTGYLVINGSEAPYSDENDEESAAALDSLVVTGTANTRVGFTNTSLRTAGGKGLPYQYMSSLGKAANPTIFQFVNSVADPFESGPPVGGSFPDTMAKGVSYSPGIIEIYSSDDIPVNYQSIRNSNPAMK